MVRAIAIALLGLILVLSYQNCAPPELLDALERDSNLSAQCIADLREKALDKKEIAPEVCHSFANYRCDRHIFEPGIAQTQNEGIECFFIGGAQECIPTYRYLHDTAHLFSKENQESFLPGAEFNRQEYTCYHQQLVARGLALTPGEGATLEEAMLNSLNECLQGAHL